MSIFNNSKLHNSLDIKITYYFLVGVSAKCTKGRNFKILNTQTVFEEKKMSFANANKYYRK